MDLFKFDANGVDGRGFDINSVLFRARSSLSWGSITLVAGSLIGEDDSGRTVKSSARFTGLGGGLSLILDVGVDGGVSDMNLVRFRARSSSSWKSVCLFDDEGSLIGEDDSGRTVKSSARFTGLEGGLDLTLELVLSSGGFRNALFVNRIRCHEGGRGHGADLSIVVSVSEKDKLSLEDDDASLLILLSFLLRVSVGGARATSSGFLEEVLSFELRRRLLRRLSGGSVMLVVMAGSAFMKAGKTVSFLGAAR